LNAGSWNRARFATPIGSPSGELRPRSRQDASFNPDLETSAHLCANDPYPMRFNSDRSANRRPQAPTRSEPLNDQRFHDLIGKASAFFATAERDMVAEKAAAITEIKALMAEYGLTLDDLRDPVEADSLRRDPSPH